MFITALFPIFQSWKQKHPRYPTIVEQINNLWYIYTTDDTRNRKEQATGTHTNMNEYQ